MLTIRTQASLRPDADGLPLVAHKVPFPDVGRRRLSPEQVSHIVRLQMNNR